jgi:hypothetical protein
MPVALSVVGLLWLSGGAGAQNQPNPPKWPSTVSVFRPGDPTIAATVEAAYKVNGGHDPPCNGQFSAARYAFLFRPGTYDVDVPVGYYTQVLGLGQSPDDVIFTGPRGVYAEEGDYGFTVGALNNFWRSAENFQTTSTYSWFPGFNGMLWAVSQASPLRRVHVRSDLVLFQYVSGDAAGFASGGFMANSQVDGTVFSGSQQQWLTRNCRIGRWVGGVWNMVFSGTQGAPEPHCSNAGGSPYVVEPSADRVAEKPFLTVDDRDRYFLNVPAVRSSAVGPDWGAARSIPFEQVYVADAAHDTADTINTQLGKGLHVVFAPGVYHLERPLTVTHRGQVLLGLGLATLVASGGRPAIHVDGAEGVRVAGLLLEAGTIPTDVLLQWGPKPSLKHRRRQKFRTSELISNDLADPGVLSDVFVRVGGPGPVGAVGTMVHIAADNVIIDNMWLWRADHDVNGLVFKGDNPCATGLVVDGNGVTAYGLAVEHTLGDLVQWNGDRGRTVFFQAELPYDVTGDYGDEGYTGYRVGANVTDHAAWGAGVYHFFRDHPVTVQSAIVAPKRPTVRFVSPLAVYLAGQGTVTHVLGDKGPATSATSPTQDPGAHIAWLC